MNDRKGVGNKGREAGEDTYIETKTEGELGKKTGEAGEGLRKAKRTKESENKSTRAGGERERSRERDRRERYTRGRGRARQVYQGKQGR